MEKQLAGLLLSISIVLGGCLDDDETTPAPSFNTNLPLALVMEHMITPAAFGFWGASGFTIDETGEHDHAPKNEAEWEEVVNYTVTLLEATNVLLLPGRIRDENWVAEVRKMAALAERAYQAAEARDAQGISDIGDELVVVCDACHGVYQLPGI